MALSDPQKGFYDSRRYFQGKDNPDKPEAPVAPSTGGIPRSQLIAGMIFFALIALGFYFFALPPKVAPEPAPAAIPTAPAAPAAH